jgi:hypothetical protein
MQGRLKEGIPGRLKEILGRTPVSISIHDGNLGIFIRTALAAPPQSEHQMTGRMMSWLLPSSVVVVLNHVLAVIPLSSRISVLQPGGILVTIRPEFVEKNDQMSVVLVWVYIVGVGPGVAQRGMFEVQPSGQEACVVPIKTPAIEVRGEHIGNGVGKPGDQSGIVKVGLLGIGDKAGDCSWGMGCNGVFVVETETPELKPGSGPFDDGSREVPGDVGKETAIVEFRKRL